MLSGHLDSKKTIRSSTEVSSKLGTNIAPEEATRAKAKKSVIFPIAGRKKKSKKTMKN